MKHQEITFKHPIKILQVFRNIHIYGKEGKSYADRTAELEWKEISSKGGYIRDGNLFLPVSILDDPDFSGCDLITMEDDNKGLIPATNRCLHLSRRNLFEIFEIRKGNSIEIHLRYGHFEVGVPKRNNFKLCELKANEPVEIEINGKIDHTLSAGMERMFKEQHYIFEYLGDFKKCLLLLENDLRHVKTIPVQRKIVDLIKPLW